MNEKQKQYLIDMEAHGAEHGWVAPMAEEDTDYLVHFRAVCKRYNIVPSKATPIEYDFVVRITDSEFYQQRANA